jgi:hypothetical protein
MPTYCGFSEQEMRMAGLETGDFGAPDETRTPDKTRVYEFDSTSAQEYAKG